MAVCVCAQAQTINPLDEVDAQVKEATLQGHNTAVEKSLSHYLDIEGEYVGNNLDEMVGKTRVVFGAQLGVYAKVDYQNGSIHPEFGIEGAYSFKRAMATLKVGARRNTYTKYQDQEANEPFWGLATELQAMYAVAQSKNHHTKFSLGVYGTFNLTGQRHEFEAHEETFDFEYENDFRARTFGAGVVCRLDRAPGFMSTGRYAFEIKAGFGQDYEYNNHHSMQFNCAATVIVGLNLHKTKTGKISAKTGRMISQY